MRVRHFISVLLLACTVGAFILFAESLATTEIVKGESVTALVSTGNEFVDEINTIRYKNGVNPLAISVDLEKIAIERSADMVANEYYAHRSPSGKYFDDLMDRDKLNYSFACENLDLAFVGNIETYISDWMASTKGHRECLLSNKVSKIGVATQTMPVTGASDSVIATAIFSD